MIAAAQPISYSVLVATAAILFWIAATDLRSFKIPNNIILVLVALFCLYMLVSGRWAVLHWHARFRGGHVPRCCWLAMRKTGWAAATSSYLTVAFLWTGPHCALGFSLIMLAFALLHTLVCQARDGFKRSALMDASKLPLHPPSQAGLSGSSYPAAFRQCSWAQNPNSARPIHSAKPSGLRSRWNIQSLSRRGLHPPTAQSLENGFFDQLMHTPSQHDRGDDADRNDVGRYWIGRHKASSDVTAKMCTRYRE